MPDAEFAVGHARLDIEGAVGAVGVVQLRQQTIVRALGEAALLVNQRENTKLALDEIQTLAVVNPSA